MPFDTSTAVRRRHRGGRRVQQSTEVVITIAAPHWDAHARGLITGLTLGASRAEFARAAIECVAHQVADVVVATVETLGTRPHPVVHADGGAAGSDRRDARARWADAIGQASSGHNRRHGTP